jgi:glutamyl-tRNA synthetase
MTIGEFTKRLIPHLVKAGYVDVEPTAAQMALVDAVVPILQPRLEVPLMKAPEAMSQFFEEPVAERTKLLGKNGTVETIDASLVAAHETLSALIPFDVTSIGACLKDTAAQKGLKKELLMAARVAITGKEKSLPLFETIEILGREKTLARLALARKQLG